MIKYSVEIASKSLMFFDYVQFYLVGLKVILYSNKIINVLVLTI
jgi:hypothetical protein